MGIEVGGILGFDFLSRFVTKIDFANELLSFYDPEAFKYEGDGHVVDMHVREGVFGVDATLDGTHKGGWLFDLGAGRCSLDELYARRNGYLDRAGVLGLGHGAGNEFKLKHIRCDSLQFAGFTLYSPLVSFAYETRDTALVSDQIGTLGNSLFRHFVLYCDYAHERLMIEKGDKFDYDWPEDNSGLSVAFNDDKQVEVLFVSPGTPAERAGLAIGDIVRSIDGVDTDSLDGLSEIRTMLCAKPGTTYDFVVERNKNTVNLKIELAKLL